MQFLNILAQCAPQGGKDGAAGGGGMLSFLVMMVLMIAIMYFVVYRPQIKQRKAHEAELAGMKKGDRILTSGGIYGKITNVKDNVLVVEISKDVEVEVARATVARVIQKD